MLSVCRSHYCILHTPPVVLGSFLVLWLVQGVWVFVTMLPVLLLNTTPTPAALLWSDVAGPLLWAVGLTVESVADWQKFVFKMDAANKGRFINTGVCVCVCGGTCSRTHVRMLGLWSLSRYPNYFGEMAVWWGMCIACLPAMTSPWTYAAGFASPLFVTYLLTCVSGIPLQEKQACGGSSVRNASSQQSRSQQAQQRWGNEAGYQRYRQTTRLLLPLPKQER